MDLGLKDKIVVVTGGASGIGAAITKALADEGAIPVIYARRAPEEAFLQTLAAKSPRAGWIKADLSVDDDCRRAVQETHARWGQVYGLVNNAGANDGIGLDAGPDAALSSQPSRLAKGHTRAWSGSTL